MLASVIAIIIQTNSVKPEQTSYLIKQEKAYEIQPGESLIQKQQREEKEEKERKEKEILKQQTQSYTGYGNPVIIGESWEQCVIYAKRKSGITRPIGYAGTAKIDGYEPREGAIGIEKSNTGHAIFIEKIIGTEAIISESNYIKGKITQRILPLDRIRGYIYKEV